MKFNSIAIKNFKCFEELDKTDFSRITILAGPNSSGKTSLLFSILGALQTNDFPLFFSTNGKYAEMGDYNEIVFKHINRREINFQHNFERDNHIYDLDITFSKNLRTGQPILKKLNVISQNETFKILNTGQTFRVSYTLNVEAMKSNKEDKVGKKMLQLVMGNITDYLNVTNAAKPGKASKIKRDFKAFLSDKPRIDFSIKNLNEFRTKIAKINNFQFNHFINRLFGFYNSFDNSINYISSFRLQPERTFYETRRGLKVKKFGQNFIDQILAWRNIKSTKYNELIKILSDLKLCDRLTIQKLRRGLNELRVKAFKKGVYSSIYDVGFGVSQFLPILVADLQLEDHSTLFIAQPEIHLHPSVQAQMANYFQQKVSDSKISKNYVIETHSQNFINRIRLLIVEEKLKPEDVVMYYFVNGEKGVKKNKVVFDIHGKIIGAPKDYFSTYMVDVLEIAKKSFKHA